MKRIQTENGSGRPAGGENCGNCALKAGSVLDDRYVIGKVIGTGGFGITYLAYDTELEKAVAVKEYFPKGVVIRGMDNVAVEPITSFHSGEFSIGAEKFRNEAEILSGLGDSADIIKVQGVFGQNGTIYYVMEYIRGITVSEYTKKYGKINERQALHMAESIAVTFGHIHSRNIIHRDLSPNNILLTDDGKVKLVDFGNARPFFYDGENSMTVALKPGFAPLEQYQHHGNHGPWTDIYSLGTVLYYALTLETPKDPMTRLEDDSDFRKGLSKINSGFASVINKMTSVKIGSRYSDAKELLSALGSVKMDPERFNTDP